MRLIIGFALFALCCLASADSYDDLIKEYERQNKRSEQMRMYDECVNAGSKLSDEFSRMRHISRCADTYPKSDPVSPLGAAGFERLWKDSQIPATASNNSTTNSSRQENANHLQQSAAYQALVYGTAAGIISIIIWLFKAKPWRYLSMNKLIDRANTRTKRIALLVLPFLTVVSIYRFVQDSDRNQWEPSLSFLMFSMASVLCLLIAFTKVGDWVQGQKT